MGLRTGVGELGDWGGTWALLFGENKYLVRLNLEDVEAREEARHPSPAPLVLDSASV